MAPADPVNAIFGEASQVCAHDGYFLKKFACLPMPQYSCK